MLKIIESNMIKDFEKGPIRRSLFSNGAVSLVHHAKGFSGARVQLHFLAGSMFESEKEEGLAHLIEHMIFKEIKTTLIRDMENMGAGLNAYTYKENVCFELTCMAGKLEKILPLFFQKFFHIDFIDESLTKEKEVIVKELKEDLDDHETQAIETIFVKNFDYPLGHPIGGSIKKIPSYTRQDILHFYRKYFRPDRMILTIVSGKKHSKIETLYLGHMDNFFKFSLKKPFRLKAVNKVGELKHFKMTSRRKMENAIYACSYNAPSINSKEYYKYAILDELLFSGLDSVLFNTLRIKQPLVYGFSSIFNCFRATGSYVMFFNTQVKDLPQLKRSLNSVLKKYSEELVEPALIESIKERILDTWELSFDDLDERVEFISGNEVYQLSEYSTVEIKKRISAVNSLDIKKLVKKMRLNSYSELVFRPK